MIKKYLGPVSLALLIIALLAHVLARPPRDSSASAPQGYPTVFATTSQITLAPYEMLQIFATSTDCTSRVMSPPAVQIRVMFGDHATVPSAGVGHQLSASTTEVFDSGMYGCGKWRAFNNSGTTTQFTITEFKGFR